MKHITPGEAQGIMGDGAQLYLVPYTSNITGMPAYEDPTFRKQFNSPVPGTDVVLSYPSLVVTEASGYLLRDLDNSWPGEGRVTALGEATFGKRYPTTTQLIAHHLGTFGVRERAVLNCSPKTGLNSTAEQLHWVRKHTPGSPDRQRLPYVFIGHAMHHPRLDLLGKVFDLPGDTYFVDAQEALQAAGITPDPRIKLLETDPHNLKYERDAMKATEVLARGGRPMGAVAIRTLFKIGALARSANVVDILSRNGMPGAEPQLILTNARDRVRDPAAPGQRSYTRV